MPDNAKGPREAGADDDEHQRAHDREDHLRLYHGGLARRRSRAARAHRQCGAKRGGQRQPHHRFEQRHLLGSFRHEVRDH